MKISIRTALGVILFVLSHAAAAVSFDCAKAKSIPEHLICSTPELSAADDQLKAVFDTARSLVVDKKQFAKETEEQWKWREKNCRDVQCVKSWYERQYRTLTALIASISGSGASSSTSSEAPVPVPTAPPAVSVVPPMDKPKEFIPTEIVRAYRENEIAAKMQFEGKPFPMVARVAVVGIDNDQQPYIGAFTNFPGTFLKIEASPNSEGFLATLHQWDVVHMTCIGEGLDDTGQHPIVMCGNFAFDAAKTQEMKRAYMPSPTNY